MESVDADLLPHSADDVVVAVIDRKDVVALLVIAVGVAKYW